MRILVGDDHELVREGIKKLLSDVPDIEHVGDARNADEVLEALQRGQWDVLVLDLNLPGRSGLDTLKEVKHRYPSLPVRGERKPAPREIVGRERREASRAGVTFRHLSHDTRAETYGTRGSA
jgi:CheY-like chemotaxis protein